MLPTSASKFTNVPNAYGMGFRYGLPLAWIGRNPDKVYLMEELDRTLDEFQRLGITVLETGGQGSGSDIVPEGALVSDTWREMFKLFLRKCTERGIHVHLTGKMSAQPLGYLPKNSDGNEGFRPKRLYATAAAKGLAGSVNALTLHGESINFENRLIAVVAVRAAETPNGQPALTESMLLDGFALTTEAIPAGAQIADAATEARLYIEHRMDDILTKIDMSTVLRGCSGFVNDDGSPNTTPLTMDPGGMPEPEPGAQDTPPEGFPPPPANDGEPFSFSPPGYEKRSILGPAQYKVTVQQTRPLTLPAGVWDIIAYYELTNPKNTHTPNPTPFSSFDDDARYTITNCFTAQGAEHVIDTYETYIFDDELRELFRENKGGLFYDGGDGDPRVDDTTWSENLPDAFEHYTGYSLLPYLPVIYSGYTLPGNGEQRLLTEKYKVLSILYKEFLTRMSQWMATYNAGYHHQVAYSSTLETQEAMRGLSCPEVESLNYMSNPGAYIAATAAARLENKRLVSCEMGATFRNPYRGKLRNLMTEINTALISGVNQMKLHTGTFVYGEKAVWPGANIHYSSLPDFNATQPFWLEFAPFAAAINRGQYAVRRGVARRDVMVYLREFMKPEGNYDCLDDLVRAGYTYDFYDAEMICDAGDIADGMIQPDRAAFRAFVIDGMKYPCMPVSAAKAILNLAENDIPIVVSGSIPQEIEGLHDDSKELRSLWDKIMQMPKTRFVEAFSQVPSTLSSLGVLPRLLPDAPSGITSWLTDADGIRCYYLFNQHRTYYHPYPLAAGTTQCLSLEGTGTPYQVDLWTGKITEFSDYERCGNRIRIPISMKPGQAAIILIGGEEQEAPGITVPTKSETITLDTGWTLQVESWKPKHPYGTSAETPEGIATEKVMLSPVLLDALKPWKDIPEIGPAVSGVGYYSNTFNWTGDTQKVSLDLGVAYDTVRVWINGIEAPVDHLVLRGEIGHLLKQGENLLEIRSTSSLCNVMYDLGALVNEFGWAEYGLLGPVTICSSN